MSPEVQNKGITIDISSKRSMLTSKIAWDYVIYMYTDRFVKQLNKELWGVCWVLDITQQKSLVKNIYFDT